MSSDDEEDNQTADKDIYPTETEMNIDITISELYQMCTSAAITKDGFRRSNTSMNVAVDESSTIMVEDGEFCLKEFNTALFQLGEKQIQSHLSALEATEYIIHRNIKHRLKSYKESTLKPGDKVLFKNPIHNSNKTNNPFSPRNIIGKVIEVVPGGLCKVSYGDDADGNGSDISFEKNIFIGQLIKWGENDDPIEMEIPMGTNEEQITKKQMLNEIVEFSEYLRRDFYASKLRSKLVLNYPINSLMEYACITYDHGLMAKLYEEKNDERSEEQKKQFDLHLKHLKVNNFPCFMYSTIHWERKRMIDFGELLNTVTYVPDDHDCKTCFDSDEECQHQCCKKKALDFAQRCGLVRITKKHARTDINSIVVSCGRLRFYK